MGQTTIEWTATRRADGTMAPGYSFNPWSGCTKVSDGCKNCYAEALSRRNPATLGIWGPKGARAFTGETYWKQPVKWNRDAEKASERRRVFCASLADVFEELPDGHPQREQMDTARARLFRLIQQTPSLDWLILTKRPENIEVMLHGILSINPPGDAVYRRITKDLPLPNVWFGTSVENQETADERIPHLLNVPAVVRFLSCEPLLGPVDLINVHSRHVIIDALNGIEIGPGYQHTGEPRISWVIVGGESGPNARPMHPAWARSIRDQCGAANVPFFFKQWGEWLGTMPDESKPMDEVKCHEWNGGVCAWRVGKKRAGRLLSGIEHNGFPAVAL